MAIANIIDTTYFVNDIPIPVENKDGDRISQTITNTQEQVLRDLLGDELYIAIDGGSYSDFFTKLKEGQNYYIGNNRVKFEGLRGNITTKQNSPLAYFTFYEYIKADHYVYSKAGTTSKLSVNQKNVSPLPLMAYAYNRGVELYGGFKMKAFDRSLYAFIVNGEYDDKTIILGLWDFNLKCKIPSLAL